MNYGRIKVVTSKYLYEQGLIGRGEYRSPMFHNKKVLKFNSLTDAINFRDEFVQTYLVPKYGLEKALRFPMAKTGPWNDFGENLAELTGVKKPNPDEETWLVVPEDSFTDIEEFFKLSGQK